MQGQAVAWLDDDDERGDVILNDGNRSKASQGTCDLQTPLKLESRRSGWVRSSDPGFVVYKGRSNQSRVKSIARSS